MPNSPSAEKRLRQNADRRLHNRSVKSELKTLTKKLLAFVEAGDRESAGKLYPTVVSKMDKAGRRRIYHPNTIARKKSALTRLMNGLSGRAPAAS